MSGVTLPAARPDDAALNAGVAALCGRSTGRGRSSRRDSAPTGQHQRVPVLTLHAIHDPTAFVELESAYREIAGGQAGNGALLVQTFSDEHEHSYLSDPQYPALLTALLDWVDHGDKPTPTSVAARCKAFEASYGPGCRIRPGYRSPPLASRVTPRQP
jgi:hypothetical protein